MNLLEKILLEKASKKKPVSSQSFDEIVKFMEGEKAIRAQEKVETLLDENRPDIRIIAHYLYIQFLKNGVVSLLQTLPFLQNLIKKKWKTLEPKTLLEVHTQTSTNWLFSQIAKKLEYCKMVMQKDAQNRLLWEKCHAISPSENEALIDEIKTFVLFFQSRWPKSQAIKSIYSLSAKIKEMKKEPSQEEKQEELVEEEDCIQEEPLLPNEVEKQSPNPTPSKPFEKLISLIKIFENLIENESYNKAAVCAQVITSEIENFDPIHYFPELFSTFLSLHAKHADVIAHHWESKENLQWKLLKNLLSIDSDAFVNW
ncbi:MAG: type VI secretion system protein IglI family protein [Candidatus Algichlamydia australiensis]|nr:type VI secretion system protein IglI family protein [Chlamydiales bacterium]